MEQKLKSVYTKRLQNRGPGPATEVKGLMSNTGSSQKDMMLFWCQCRLRDYEDKGIKAENFSSSWADGRAFCALIHHFFPDAVNIDSLDPKNRRANLELAFRLADEKAGVFPMLDLNDMMSMEKPDWKSVFAYVQSLYKALKDL